ncbi:hypothetical protein E2C01_080698 [Portunus trituberculatus]|uniref:Uncharacterized protein n=1 Tax=Portunus trituberculatus TaxID=210409 RepID=A0A5B7IUQ7_PORTR|nr:hypothetical protein [Portunus trituberculatus]
MSNKEEEEEEEEEAAAEDLLRSFPHAFHDAPSLALPTLQDEAPMPPLPLNQDNSWSTEVSCRRPLQSLHLSPCLPSPPPPPPPPPPLLG